MSVAFLGSFGPGPSDAVLPLDGAPTYAGAPNFDTDRNDDPGLTIQRSSDGLVASVDEATTLISAAGTTAVTVDPGSDPKVQVWAQRVGSSGARLAGAPVLEIWAAARDFDPGATQRVVAALVVCDGSGNACQLLSSGSAGFAQSGFGKGFGLVTVFMTDVDVVVPEGHWVGVVVTVANSSDRDLWVVFDSVDHPSRAYLR